MLKSNITICIVSFICCATACHHEEPLPIIEEISYFTEYEILADKNQGYFNYSGWDIYINLADSFLFTSDTIHKLKNILDETNDAIDSYTIGITQSQNYILLENTPLQGKFIPTTGSEKGIIIFSNYQLKILVHEIGHARYWNNSDYSKAGYSATNVMDIYPTQKELWGSERAADNKWEYFAELFRYIYLNPDYLFARDKNGYDFIQKVLAQR